MTNSKVDSYTGGHNANTIDKRTTMKNQNRSAALGRPAIKITGGLQLVCGRPTLALSSALVPQTLSCLVCVEGS